MTSLENRPLPPASLIERVAGTDNADWFVHSGGLSVRDIRAALETIGRRPEQFHQILDFGCGCGRILTPMLAELPQARFSGVDIDDEALSWLRRQYPGLDLRTVDPLPPLPFPDNTFDLVYCHSVFTHMDVDYQDRWLAELRRVTAPGAILIVSFSGAEAFGKLLDQWNAAGVDPAPIAAQLAQDGTLFISDDGWKDGPFPDFYHSMFHTAAYVQRHWGGFLAIRAHLPMGSLAYQDFVVMETLPKEPMAPPAAIPFPPLEFRKNVGPVDLAFFDNPSGELVFPEIPPESYARVFDFGCGCGRIARQLLQQRVRPERYVGIDIHRAMVEWNRSNLSSVDPRFQFLVHDVFNLGLAPDNSRQDFAPFPVGDEEFTLVNAHSVFTHILQPAAVSYLHEVRRILAPDGIARTTWFFFDKRGFPWMEQDQVCLFVNEIDPTNAVIYDRNWFMETIAALGLTVVQVLPPALPGHQWTVFLKKGATEEGVGDLLTAEASESLSGALPFWKTHLQKEFRQQLQEMSRQLLAQVEENKQLRASWSWRVTAPFRTLQSVYLAARNQKNTCPDTGSDGGYHAE
jgi:SAM-dependent methyltransferase